MNYTSEQLRNIAAAMDARERGLPVQFLSTASEWCDLHPTYPLRVDGCLYRPKPEPVTRQWSKRSDVPLNCWLRIKTTGGLHAFVDGVNDLGIFTRGSNVIRWADLQDYEHSTDLKTWKPCEVTEP